MKTISLWLSIVAVMSVLAGAAVAQSFAQPEDIVSGPEAAQYVTVRDVTAQGGTVAGVLVNDSPYTLRDIQLLVRRPWIWANERHPGEFSPGRADFTTVHIEILPHGTAPFTFQGEPLLQRSDGHFAETAVQVVGFTQVGGPRTAASAPYPR